MEPDEASHVEQVGIPTLSLDKILPAISAAMSQVAKVGKSGRNEHDKYNFASVDDFLAMVNPVCAANGLIIHMDEAGSETFARKGKFGDSTWMRARYHITLMHSSGQHLPTVTRTVEVLSNGSQAFGSAQSYVLKQYLRGVLLIATGDKDDADLQATDNGEIVEHRAARPDAAQTAATSIGRAETLDMLKEIWKGLPKSVQANPDVIAAKDKRKSELDLCDSIDNPAAEIDDEIPEFEVK